MPRRGASSSATTSAQVNSGPSKRDTRVKAEKVAIDNGKQDADVEAEDADAEGDEDDEHTRDDESADQNAEVDHDDNDGSSPRGPKRARVNGDGDSHPTGKGKGKGKERVVTQPRDADGYIPGSIVRIQLKNFVTYDYVEFRPGPYLNMIIGPNGTGKSSIACAICLGLNWPPSVLGRANELSSFVKMGADTGYIEIELKGPKGKPNLTIRRNLSAKAKGSTFTLNGQSATGAEIKMQMAHLNVQVGNKCSFLPQDKVSEFAGMSPQDLLKETQRAAGDTRLTEWHQTLIDAGKECRSMNEKLNEEVALHKQLVERNEGIERDVQRFLERKEIEHQIEILQILVPVQKYRELRVQWTESKEVQRRLHKKVKLLKEKNEPAHNLLRSLDQEMKEYDKAREDAKTALQAKFKKMGVKSAASEKFETDAEELMLKLDQLKKEEKERVRKMKSLEADIVRIEAELAKPVKLEKVDSLNQEARQLNIERSGVIGRKHDLDQLMSANIDKRAKARASLEQANNELGRLDDVNNRKLQNMQRWDRDTHDAIIWLRNNRDKFRMEVFEPPFMCLTVPDVRFVNAIEACFSAAQLKTFVAQCKEDNDTMNHYINDTASLGRKVRVTTWFRPNQQELTAPPPMSAEELQNLGFDGYALDYVDCPPGMHWFLKRELNLHRTAIALNGNSVDVNSAMQAVSRPGPNGRGGGASFIAGSVMNIVTRSSYGRNAVSNMTRDVRPARNLVAASIDPEFKRKLDMTIASAKQEIEMIDEEKSHLKTQMDVVVAEDTQFHRKLTDIKMRKDAILEAERKLAQLRGKLERQKAQLETARNAPSVDQARLKIKQDLLRITKQRVKIAREYTEFARSVISEQSEMTRMGLEFLQVSANKAALQALCDKKDEKYTTALAEFNEADRVFKEVKAESVEALSESRAVVAGVSDELRDEYRAIEDARSDWEKNAKAADEEGQPRPSTEGIELRNLDELQAELDIQRANLDLNLTTNPGVVEQYEKRKRDIEQLDKTIDEKRKKVEKVERNIKIARDNWQPALEKLVGSIGEKFSAAFDRIGCAGEIRINEHEDYEKWAIDILVKFRDSEKLQLLTGQRQSGGERSLTTILYLMSLTEEARAPFSLVDEINQGMDQRAERMVHNSMVEVTCKADSAQYFLITPKLLPDLQYHERMKILCVNNGEWLPDVPELGNMMDMIEGFVQRKNREPNAV